ncbi:metallophosphoesterase family protein [Bacteroidota bacterium]
MKRKYYYCLIFSLLCFALAGFSQRSVRFGVCTDLHKDIMPDADYRLETFINRMVDENPNFVIQLGDFCYPKEENNSIKEIWNRFSGRKFHVLGGNDMDKSSKEETKNYWGMTDSYYSFDEDDFHFVVLDANYYKEGSDYIAYENGNYLEKRSGKGYINPEQLEWLENDIKTSTKLTIIFSHQNIENKMINANLKDVRKILEEENSRAGFKKVIACFSGFGHTNTHREIKGIHYIQINSMSYYWLGEKYECETRYTEEDNNKFPDLRNTAPYRDPLYAIVEISTDGSIKIEGIKSRFISPSPMELGVSWSFVPGRISSSIPDRTIEFR